MQILMMIEILIVPLLILVLGILFRCGIPRKRNRWFGIRNRTTMKSQEAWQYAHRVCAAPLIVLGLLLLAAAVLLLILFADAVWFVWASSAMVLIAAAAMLFCLWYARMKIEKRFGQ